MLVKLKPNTIVNSSIFFGLLWNSLFDGGEDLSIYSPGLIEETKSLLVALEVLTDDLKLGPKGSEFKYAWTVDDTDLIHGRLLYIKNYYDAINCLRSRQPIDGTSWSYINLAIKLGQVSRLSRDDELFVGDFPLPDENKTYLFQFIDSVLSKKGRISIKAVMQEAAKLGITPRRLEKFLVKDKYSLNKYVKESNGYFNPGWTQEVVELSFSGFTFRNQCSSVFSQVESASGGYVTHFAENIDYAFVFDPLF